MDIDLVITELEVGGAERALTQLAVALHHDGDRVRVFSLSPPPKRTELVERLDRAGIPVCFGSARSWRDIVPLRRRLRAWLRERPEAICQSFLFHANVLTATCLESDRRAVAGIRVAERRAVRCIIEKRALRRFDHVVCVSQAVAQFADSRLGVTADRCSVIGNAVEADRFRSVDPFDWRSIGWEDESRVALFIGRFHPQKNLAALQRTALSWLADDTSRKLVLVGDGPQRQSLEAWATGIGPDRVRVMPWQPDVAPLLAACRVLVLPSRYEGMPNVILEAMAAGRPVVCSRVEGSEELVGGDDLQSYPPDDDAQLIERMDCFLGDGELAERVGASNRQRVCDRFSVAKMAAAYRRTYRTVLASASGPPLSPMSSGF